MKRIASSHNHGCQLEAASQDANAACSKTHGFRHACRELQFPSTAHATQSANAYPRAADEPQRCESPATKQSAASLTRRGQVEMVGLVIIVALLIVGIVLYMTLSAKTSGVRASATKYQGSTDFVTALAATYVPACRVQFWEVAQACMEQKPIGGCATPAASCVELQRTMDAVAGAALLSNGYKYNLSITGTGVQSMDGCKSADPRVNMIQSTTPLQLGYGIKANLTLSLCR